MTTDIRIVFEDDDFFVVDKPPGLKVHCSHKNDQDATLVQWLLECNRPLSRFIKNENTVYRPGIVHRLDTWTSGLLIIAKSDEIHSYFEKLMSDRLITKVYRAILSGRLKQPELLLSTELMRDPKRRTRFIVAKKAQGNPEKSREAISKFVSVRSFTLPFTLAEIEIFTGRTHQIRAQAHYLNAPILGDDLYGFHFDRHKQLKKLYDSLGVLFYLQAAQLKFEHPRSHLKIDIRLDPPNYFAEIIKILE